MARVTVADDADTLTRIAADRLTTLVTNAIDMRGTAFVSLTGGSTPRTLYETLARSITIDWRRVVLCWGDERHVPPEHPDSNFGMTNRTLVSRVAIPPSQVHRIRGELDPQEAARAYDQELRMVFGGPVVFDVMLLGVGEDAHIASIFPSSSLARRVAPAGSATAAAGAADLTRPDLRPVAAVFVPHLNAWRITLTPAVILASRTIVLLVSGAQKAAAVHAALEAPLDVERYPAQMLRETGDRAEWLIDRAAARSLAAPPA